MSVSAGASRPHPRSLAGALVALAGVGFVGAGLWARTDVRRTLARERIATGTDGTAEAIAVASPGGARSTAELIRRNTLDATGGRTYAEIPAYVGADGSPTADAALAARDERTGEPLENPEHALWVQSTALQTALMQAYLAFRLSELIVALGGSFVLIGIGLSAPPPRHGR